MWIRSQDGTDLVDVNHIVIIDNKLICKGWTLGVYETPSKAKSVLDLIHQHINDFAYNMAIGAGPCNVFRMPKQ